MPATVKKAARRPSRTGGKRERVKRMTPAELARVARAMVEARDPKEANLLQERLVRGFYGDDE